MLIRHDRTERGTALRLRAAAVPLAALLLAALTACSDPAADSGGDNAGGSTKGGGAAKSADPKDKALAFAKCMRENGVAKFPDPDPGGGIKLTPESGVDMQSSAFKKAQEACKKFSPQGDAGNVGKLDPTKVADWAKCIRAHGVPKFSDPEVQGNNMSIDLTSTGLQPQSDKFQKAMAACRSKAPKGGMLVKGGGGGQ
jgi:hypothetical protein